MDSTTALAESSGDISLTLVIIAVIVILYAIYYFNKQQYVEPDKTFDEVMDEYNPESKQQLIKVRLQCQEIQNQITEIDDRLREIRETNLGGHSSAYYTRELNELSMKRNPLANKLQILKDKERDLGLELAKFTDKIIEEENSPY